MLKTILQLSDGTRITSGRETISGSNIRSHKYTESTNSDVDIAPGSVCTAMLECTLQLSGERISQGDTIILFKADEKTGEEQRISTLIVNSVAKTASSLCKLTAYDNICKLDVPLSEWLDGLDNWPYRLDTFAKMVCNQCGVTFVTDNFPNADFPVKQFSANDVTGRQLLGWAAEIAAKFARATPDGNVEFAWYEDTDMVIGGASDHYIYGGSLTYESYKVHAIDAVQIQMANGESGYKWPPVIPGSNAYVINGNRLITEVSDGLHRYLDAMRNELQGLTYTPCALKTPASLHLRCGQLVTVTTPKGETFRTCIMSRTQTAATDKIESTGYEKRENPVSANNYSSSDLKDYANNAASSAVKGQTQLDLFNKLTSNGRAQGLYITQDGQIFINAEYMATGVLRSKDGTSFYLDLDSGVFRSAGKFMAVDENSYITVEGDALVLYTRAREDSAYEDIARIGFSRAENGNTYPYLLMGRSDDEQLAGKLGLVKMFSNGVFVGNSVPKDSVGAFVGMPGATGTFTDTEKGITYNVFGEEMRYAWIARFG